MMATSPNHDGVEGTDWGEVWILTAEDAILLMKPPEKEIGLFFFPFREAHFYAFYYPPSTTSLRNSWVHLVQVGMLADEQPDSFVCGKLLEGSLWERLFMFSSPLQ